MKKIIVLTGLILLTFFSIIPSYDARTLKDLKDELAELQAKRDENKKKESLTKQQMNEIDNRITEIMAKNSQSEKKIVELSDEIVELEEKSEQKKEDINDVFAFLQVTNSNNAYLEYIFGATSITDLIFRSAISEQLINYNQELIKEYAETVKECTKKKNELEEEIVVLNKEQENLKGELVKLGDSLTKIVDVYLDIDSDIETQKKMIEYYEKTLGCKDNEDINSCGGNIPYSGKMIRPVSSGYITSAFGYRKNPLGFGSETSFHNGIDISGGSTAVYAPAPGTVAGITWKARCGGNMVYIHHNVGGVYYTTGYYHLSKVLVSVGQYVDQNTQIGVMGGNSSTPWDTCSTGTHLHFSVASGLYLKQYSAWNTYISKQVDPTSVVNFPRKGVWWSNRTTTY